jgi:hypothetical protein
MPDIQTNVEVCAVHGVFEEFYRQWLKHGHYVGVHGGGDNHMTSTGNANPGYHYSNTNGLAAAWVPGLTRRGIWDAFKHRRTCAVTGNQRIYLDFRADGEPMGTVMVGGAGPREIRVEAAGTAPILRLEILRNGEVVPAYRPVAAQRRYLRLTWTDDWCSRRVDDSVTTGTIAVEGATLKVVAALNAFHLTDAFTARDGAVDFRSNAYSGITRGLLAEVTGNPGTLRFAVRDLFQGRAVLDTSFDLALDREEIRAERFLDLGERKLMPLFSRELHRPRFMFEAAWVDPVWPKTVTLDWTDEDAAPAYYTVRMEQIDGNIAWSSPIWFLDRWPEPAVPGRVVRR